MTDDAPLPDDELASAYLDDAVDDDERARVESSPDLLARVDQLASVRPRRGRRPHSRRDATVTRTSPTRSPPSIPRRRFPWPPGATDERVDASRG